MRGAARGRLGWMALGVLLTLGTLGTRVAGEWLGNPLTRSPGTTEEAAGGGVDPRELKALRAQWDGERLTWQRREVELQMEIERLGRELAEGQERGLARQTEWLEYTRVLSSLPVPGAPAPPEFLDLPPDPPGPTPAEREAAERVARRSAEVLADLRALLMAEQVLALDVLEVGRVHQGFTGPVVVRLLDEYGRPVGTLAAERLRLEVSRAGRTVTLVFEEGFESHGGLAVPFGAPGEPGSRRGGVRRMDLVGVDPQPWIEAFGELVDEAALVPNPDDGLWNLIELRLVVDNLLRTDTTGGHWRLRSLGGVVGTELRDVQLVELDRDGHVERRLFADRMTFARSGRGVVLVLEDGVQERRGRRAPFLGGAYRVYLPRARAEQWEQAGVPGMGSSPAREEDP